MPYEILEKVFWGFRCPEGDGGGIWGLDILRDFGGGIVGVPGVSQG